MFSETRYAMNGNLRVAYRASPPGARDIVFAFPSTNCEVFPELPSLQGWVEAMTSLRVDCEGGIGWVATRYDLNLRVIEQVRGSDEEVHRAAARWAQG